LSPSKATSNEPHSSSASSEQLPTNNQYENTDNSVLIPSVEALNTEELQRGHSDNGSKTFEGHSDSTQGQPDSLNEGITDNSTKSPSVQREASMTSNASLGSETSEYSFEDASRPPIAVQPPNDPPVTLDDPSRSEDDSKVTEESWNVDDAIEGTAQLLGTAGGYFFSVLGQVASSAFSLTQSAVKYLVSYNNVETWHDCDSDEDDEAFQDAAEDLTVSDLITLAPYCTIDILLQPLTV
jgi:hypothetical protein